MIKRITSSLLACAFCCAMVIGSLSFFPKSFAVVDYQFPFFASDIPSPTHTYYLIYAGALSDGSLYRLLIYESDYPFSSTNSFVLKFDDNKSHPYYRYYWRSDTGSWSSQTQTSTSAGWLAGPVGSPFPFDSNYSGGYIPTTTFNYTFKSNPVVSSVPFYWDFMPFFFPELPHGYFDGNLTLPNGLPSLTLDFGELSGTSTGSFDFSESGSGSGTYSGTNSGGSTTISGTTSETGTYTGSGQLNVTGVTGDTSGEVYSVTGTAQDSYQGNIWLDDATLASSSSGSLRTSGTLTGTVSSSSSSSSGQFQVTSLSGSGDGDLEIGQTFDGDVEGTFAWIPEVGFQGRYRTWSVVTGSEYVYFICDARNKITANIESVSGDSAVLRYTFSGINNVQFPFYAIVFDPMGSKSYSLTALPNGFTVNITAGTLSQDSETEKWSVDPLYHGFWFSQDSPSVDLSSLTEDEDLKWLANPVFGEQAFMLNFLDSINSGIEQINTNLTSLQQAMQSSISNQTSTLQNMTADPATQPSTSEMANYFAESSVFDAPSSDSFFSGSLSSAPMWSGVTWWSSKFNDIIVSNQVIVAFTTAMLTLGLAVFIIGRRVNMK